MHKGGALEAREAAGGQQEAGSPLERTVPGGKAEPRKPRPGPGGEGEPKGAHQTPTSLGESHPGHSGEEARTRLPGPVKQEEIKTSPHAEIPVEAPAEPGARDCNRGPTARAGEPLGPAHTGSPPSATTRESGMQTEPEPTLGRGKETLGQPRGGHGARLRDQERGARAASGTTPQWSEREAREVSWRVLSVLRRALEAGTPQSPKGGKPVTRKVGASASRGRPC